jgi:diguanylate cyclase (GGDEF)-like protein
MNIINGRYEIKAQLMSTNYYDVFLVDDRRTEAQLELVLLRSEISENNLIESIIEKSSFYIQKQQKFFCRVFDFNVVESVDNSQRYNIQYFYTRELFFSEETVSYLDLSRDETCLISIKLIDAVKIAHYMDHAIEYLNPENVIIIKRGDSLDIKLIDLITIEINKIFLIEKDETIIQFISPESIYDNKALLSSDYFSLGKMIFYLLYKIDYTKMDFRREISQYGSNELIDSILSMTSNIPEDRFEAVAVLRYHLENISNVIVKNEFSASEIVTYTPVYFDKNAVLSHVKAEVIKRYNYENKFNGFLITGKAGVGKTRFMEELGRYLYLKKINVISIDVNEIMKEKIGLTKKLMEILGLSDQARDIEEDLVTNQFDHNIEEKLLRVSNKSMNVILDRIKYKPIVLLIDDIHMLEEYEIKMINYYFNSNQISPMTIVASIPENLIWENFTRDESEKKIRIIELLDFDYLEASDFLKSILKTGNNPKMLIPDMMESTQGSPKRILEYVKNKIDDHELFISGNLDWFLTSEGEIKSLTGEVDTSILTSELEKLDELAKRILRVFSIFNFEIGSIRIREMLGCSQKEVDSKINELLISEFITEKLGNEGYVYQIENSVKKLLVRKGISTKEYIEMNAKAAEVISKNQSESEENLIYFLVHHYRESNQHEKAINLCLAKAKGMGESHLSTQQIKYLEMIVEINVGRNMETENVVIYRMLSESYVAMNDTSKAFVLIEKSIEIAKMMHNQTAFIDSLYIKLFLMIGQNKILEAVDILGEIDLESLKKKYLEGYFKISLVKCKLLNNQNKMDQLMQLSSHLLVEVEQAENLRYMAEFKNEVGIAHAYMNHSEKAIKCYRESYELFIKCKYEIGESRALNNIGVEYSDTLGRYSEAREYYLKALYTIENLPNQDIRIIYLSNVGESYFYEDNFQDALIYLKKAEDIVSQKQNSNFGFNVYLNLFKIYSQLNRYDIAIGYFYRLENEIKASKERGTYLGVFYLSAVEFFIHIKAYSRAEEYLSKLTHINQNSNTEKNIAIDIYRQKIIMFKSYLYDKDGYENVRLIQSLSQTTLTILEARELRLFIHETLLDLFYSNKIPDIKYLIELDEELSKRFNTDLFEFKRKVIFGIFEENRIDYFKAILNEIKGPEEKWNIYRIIGKEHFFKNQQFSAFSYLFDALNEVKQLFMLIPIEYREMYLFYDSKKIDLRNFIVNIMSKILGEYVLEDEDIYMEFEIRSADQFFKLKHYEELASHERLKNNRDSEDERYFSSINDLINAFEYNDRENLLLILKYIRQFSIADYSGIYILDNNEEEKEVIFDGGDQEEDISRILRNFYGSEGILINEFLKIGNVQFLIKGQHAAMLIPLKESINSGGNRRRDFGGTSTYRAYLYLVSNNVFNNFTVKTYDEILKLNRFIYQYVEKYYLNNYFAIDKTTGLLTRSHIEEAIHQEIYYSKITDHKFSIVMADIDKFKEINDIFGHKKGDDVLKDIGDLFKETLRETDTIGRYGGEEFVLMLRNTDETDAYEVIDRIRQKIERNAFKGLNRTITMSFGISEYPVHSETLEELIEKADQVLYISKRSGRNKVTVWNARTTANKLQYAKDGILATGDIINIKSVESVLKMIEIMRIDGDNRSKQMKMIEIVMMLTGAKYCTLIDTKSTFLSKEVNQDEFLEINLFDQYLIDDYLESESGDYFVDWRNFTELNPETGKMSWRSIISMPIDYSSQRKGLLLLGVPVYEKEFEIGDYYLINAISPILGTVL